MGIICSKYYVDNYNTKKKIFRKCYKCTVLYECDRGGYSKRRSCRYHNFIGDSCYDCRLSKDTIVKNNILTCYHVITDSTVCCC